MSYYTTQFYHNLITRATNRSRRSGRNAARLVLGFSDLSTRFPGGPQPDSRNPRFRKPPLRSRTVGFPESGSDLGIQIPQSSAHCRVKLKC